MSTLLLELWTENNDFYLYLEREDEEKEWVFKGQAEEVIAHLDTIYDILEETASEQEAQLQEAIQALSQLLITPIAADLQQCSLVRWVVYEDLNYGAFDLLHLDGQPLFLQRPVCYQVAEGYGEDEPEIECESALLIADLTADPEEACLAVSKLLPQADYAEMPQADLEMIEKAAGQLDVLVISAHGEVDDDSYGGMSLNEETISPELLAQLEAWLVYFDSCQQGINLGYLEAFQEESDIQFYLAPIISNDAGDSSTKTLLWFFTALLAHKNPIQALFTTRQRLFDYYRKQEKLDLVTTLNKAFCFRLYEFVDSEE